MQISSSFWSTFHSQEAYVLSSMHLSLARRALFPIQVLLVTAWYVDPVGASLGAINSWFEVAKRGRVLQENGIFSLHDLYCLNTSTGLDASCFAEDALPDWSIGATKSAIFADHLGANTKPNLDMMKATRTFADDFNKKYFNGKKVAYMYGYPFLFFEQYLHSSHDLYIVVGYALVGVFLAVLVFQFSLVISLMIAIVLLMVDIEVYGFLFIIDAKLNALSLVNLGIVIGMAAELTYLARSYLMVDGSRNYRVGKALEWTFEPLLHGFGTQVAATLPLIFLKYHAFRLYYFAMFTLMGVIGFLNGFVLLPVLLSWFGPPPLPHIQDQSRVEMDTKETFENGKDATTKGVPKHNGNIDQHNLGQVEDHNP